MKKSILIPILLAALSCGQVSKKISYPATPRVQQSDDYFGKKVSDPYRWLEDDRSSETAQWVSEENKITFAYLDKIPFRKKIRERISTLWNFPRFSPPSKEGKYYSFYKNDGMQNQSILYFQEGLGGNPKILIDPNKLSADGTVALTHAGFSKDQRYLAFGTSRAGSDWQQFQIMETQTGKVLDDLVKWNKFSGAAWRGNGFFYTRFEEPGKGSELSGKNENCRVYYHTLGTDQNKDSLVYEDREHPARAFSPGVTDDGRFLIISAWETTTGVNLYIKDLEKKEKNFTSLADNFEDDYSVIDNIGGKLLMMTGRNAPRKKVVLIDPAHPEEKNWKEVIPQSGDVLESVARAKDKLICKYLRDACSRLQVFSLEGKSENEITLPTLGTVSAINAHAEDSLVFYSFTSFTFPTTIYSYNIVTKTSSVFRKAAIDFDPEAYETKQVFFNSKDGTKVPMFIVHRKGMEMNGKNPAFLYSYGGFNISLTPDFRVERLALLENGGIFAEPNIRGGGEYGEEWHKAGTLCRKQNVFDDFIAAAEYLIKEKYTSHDMLAIHGRSNGGLLVGAVMTQRPDLAKVAIPTVGVLDMLRYHLFTIGAAWASDYGRSDNKEQFECLYRYSPLQNVKETGYPATLVTTGDHDDRVVPAHSFKFAATLQEKQQGDNPVLIRIDVNAGHGAGKPTSKVIEEWADIWSFMFYNMGMKVKYL